MEHVFWIIPNMLAGRPGPDREPWDLAVLRAGGFEAVLSLNDGVLCRQEDFAEHKIAYACIPLSKNAPPESGDDLYCVQALPRAYSFVIAHMAERHQVLVHCSGGKDRTGLFLCYFLMQYESCRPIEAIKRIRQVRPSALTAEGWEGFAEEVLEYLLENLDQAKRPHYPPVGNGLA